MDEHKCPRCDGLLLWVGNVLDGHMECPSCKELRVEDGNVYLDSWKPTKEITDEIAENLFTGNLLLERASGRTHGMVLRALEEASKGTQVVILTPGVHVTKYIENIIKDLGIDMNRGVFMVPAPKDGKLYHGCVRVMGVDSNTPRGVCRSVKVFADHTLYDHKWGAMRSEAFNEWRDRHEIKA